MIPGAWIASFFWGSISLNFMSLSDVLEDTAFVLLAYSPICMATIGIIREIKMKNANMYLWFCSIYWFLFSVPVLLEINKSPDKFFILLLLFSTLSIIFLVSDTLNKRRKRS
jgi:hypothetical protein